MTKVVVNRCFGGFNLSGPAIVAYAKRKGIEAHHWTRPYICSLLGKTVEAKGIFHGATVALVPQPEGEPVPVPEGQDYHVDRFDLERDDPDLIAVIEELGDEANGSCSKLKVVEIPSDVEWGIEEYDGLEHVAEKHRTWS